MSKSNSQNKLERILIYQVTGLLGLLGIAAILSLFLLEFVVSPEKFRNEPEPIAQAAPPPDPDRVENGIDVETGFIAEGDYMLVKRNCTSCHSSKMVIQNRATREGWLEMIRWMQEKQKLWDLGANEDKILDYLAKYYGPVKKGRRAPIQIEEWYEISAN